MKKGKIKSQKVDTNFYIQGTEPLNSEFIPKIEISQFTGTTAYSEDFRRLKKKSTEKGDGNIRK